MKHLLRFLSRISIRLLAFNILLVFLPAIGILSLETYEDQLLELQERSMVQQGRLLAAALAERGPLDEIEAERILVNLQQRLEARLRVVDADLELLADSSRLGPRRELGEAPSPREPETGQSALYLLGRALYQVYARFLLPPEPPNLDAELYSGATRLDGPELREALAGRYGSATRVSANSRSLALYSALPVRSDGVVVGVVLVTKSTFPILRDLYQLRLSTFKVILLSLLVAGILSLLVSTTIARPLRRLRGEALAVLDPRGRLKEPIQPLVRLDEIGDLSRALHELTRRLESHIRFIESFASDVSHELKNPLASIRNAAELWSEVESPEERERFRTMVLGDVARLEILISGVREISRIDAQREALPTEPVRLDRLLESTIEHFRLRRDHGVRLVLDLPAAEVTVRAVPERLVQVIENLLDNAISFSPEGGEVGVELMADGKVARLRVRDAGPGIPEAHREKIFDRFWSDRPGGKRSDGHTGLGLSIVRAIIEGLGGTVTARDPDDGATGAVLEVVLPQS